MLECRDNETDNEEYELSYATSIHGDLRRFRHLENTPYYVTRFEVAYNPLRVAF